MVVEPDAAAVRRKQVAAFDAGDLDALMAGFTADAVGVTGTVVARVAQRPVWDDSV